MDWQLRIQWSAVKCTLVYFLLQRYGRMDQTALGSISYPEYMETLPLWLEIYARYS